MQTKGTTAYVRLTIPCEWCGKPFLIWPHEEGRRRFHNRACYYAARREEAERRRRSAATRFWASVDVRGPDDCWLWLAGCSTGYGAFYPTGASPMGAHRYSFWLSRGRWPVGVCRHLCEGRYPKGDGTHKRCVNPSHLAEGTQGQNVRDMWESGHRTYRVLPRRARRPGLPRYTACVHCGSQRRPFVLGRCFRCYQYRRRTGRDRPLS